MKRLSGSALAVVLACSTALSAAAQERQARSLEGFDAVEVSGGIDVDLRTGQTFAVEITDGDPDEIVTEVHNRTLVIRRARSFGRLFHWDGDDGAVRVTLPQLTSLSASGGSDVRAQGRFASDTLKIDASGGSDVTIEVDAGELEATASGGSDLKLTGKARRAAVQSSGGSDFDASAFTADVADVRSSGGSDIAIAVRESIAGHASGGSDIVYSGDPRTVNVDTSGGSDVRRR